MKKKGERMGEREKWMSHQCGKPQLALIMSETLFSLDSPLALISNKKKSTLKKCTAAAAAAAALGTWDPQGFLHSVAVIVSLRTKR